MIEKEIRKVDADVYIGQLLSDNNCEERYISYILRTDGLDFVAQDVFEYMHTNHDEFNNPHLTKNGYLVDYDFNSNDNINVLFYEGDIKLNDEYSVRPMIKIANANEKTEEEIAEVIAFTGLPMVERFNLLYGYSYQKVKKSNQDKSIKNI